MRLGTVLAALLAVALATVAFADDRGVPHGAQHEIWAVDQSNTTGTTSGGALYVYDSRGMTAGTGSRSERIDLGGAATAMCLAQTGTAPVRPHMLLFNRRGSHAILSFVASGHVLFLDARKRTPLACIDVGAQAHAAVPAPDESYVVVANQNGKLVQRIRTDYRTNTFALEPDATLDLVPLEDPALRPDNAPICPIVDSSSRLAFVTLRGGGMFVLDSRATPMRIIASYDKTTIHGNGCGGVESGGRMYINSGGGTAANLSEFDVYAFNLAEFRNAAGTGPCSAPGPNLPAPKLVV